MPLFKFKHIYSTSIEKQVLTTYTNLSRFCFLGTTPVLTPNVWANEKIPKLTPAPGLRGRRSTSRPRIPLKAFADDKNICITYFLCLTLSQVKHFRLSQT